MYYTDANKASGQFPPWQVGKARLDDLRAP